MGSSLGARRPARWLVHLLAIAVSMLAAAPAGAQEPVKSFDLLNTRLKPGDTVWVTDAQGRQIKGEVLEVTPSVLVLDGGRRRTYEAGDVRAVRERLDRPLRKAALWGAVAGAGLGLVAAVANRRGYASSCTAEEAAAGCWPPPGEKPPIDWWSVPIMTGLGAGIGAIVGALLPGAFRDVYVAPRASTVSGRDACLSVAPVITPRAKGVVVSIAF